MATTSASAIAAGSACSRCHDPCYAAESVVFHGKTWHTYCFACSGCSKGLTSMTAVEHESNPYCAKCHGAFGTTGFGGALGANTGVVSSAEAKRASIDVNSNRSGFVDPLKEKQKMKAQSIAASTIKDNGSATSAQLAVERNRQAARAAERALEEDDAWDPDADDDDDFAGSAASTGIAGAKGRKFVPKQIVTGATDTCPKCHKTVGFAEKIQFSSGPFHKTCFLCSTCGKSLHSTAEAFEHDDLPYCKACFAKFHGSKTLGYGNAV